MLSQVPLKEENLRIGARFLQADALPITQPSKQCHSTEGKLPVLAGVY